MIVSFFIRYCPNAEQPNALTEHFRKGVGLSSEAGWLGDADAGVANNLCVFDGDRRVLPKAGGYNKNCGTRAVFAIGFVADAHGKTNVSLGCTGDQEAFLASFDWIVNMGSFARKTLPKIYSERWDEMPMGHNKQGGTFPLVVACEHIARCDVYLSICAAWLKWLTHNPHRQRPCYHRSARTQAQIRRC